MSSPQDFTPEQASDPATEPAVLGEIATHRPDLRPAIAGNPTTYPALLDWLANLNDPAVNEALAARAQGATGPVPVAEPHPEAPTAVQNAVGSEPGYAQAPATAVQQEADPAQAVYQATSAESVSGAAAGEARWNFRGMGIGDILRDVIAALLLLLSLPMIWKADGASTISANDRPEVLIITLASLVSLTLPYLARIGAMGPKWTVHSTRKARWLLNAPYLILVVAYVVIDVINYGDGGGLGTAAMFGLAGALLAAQPRECELGPEHEDNAGNTWLGVTSGVGGLIAAGYIASLVVFILQINKGFAPTTMSKVAPIVSLLLVAIFSLWPVFAASFGKNPGWRRALIGLGAGLAVIAFMAEPSGNLLQLQATGTVGVGADSFAGVVPLLMVNGLGAIFIPAAAAAISAPSVRRAVSPQPEVQTWMEGVRGANLLIAYIGFTALVGAVMGFWLFSEIKPNVTYLVTVLIVSIGIIIAGSAIANAISKDPVGARPKAIAGAVVTAILGIVLLSAVPGQGDSVAASVTTGHLLVTVALPVFVLISLLVPAAVREFFKQQSRERPANRAAYEWTSQGANTGYYQGGAQR